MPVAVFPSPKSHNWFVMEPELMDDVLLKSKLFPDKHWLFPEKILNESVGVLVDSDLFGFFLCFKSSLKLVLVFGSLMILVETIEATPITGKSIAIQNHTTVAFDIK
jgi:hypothetical protein